EVRAEAARALGLMQITSAVPRYNFALVAHAAGELAADLGGAIEPVYGVEKDKPARVENGTKARYLAARLLGPVSEAFEGVPEQQGSGLLRADSGPAGAYVQKVFGAVKQVAQAAVNLIGATSKEYEARKKALTSQVTALRAFLEKNPPPNRQLVQ